MDLDDYLSAGEPEVQVAISPRYAIETRWQTGSAHVRVCIQNHLKQWVVVGCLYRGEDAGDPHLWMVYQPNYRFGGPAQPLRNEADLKGVPYMAAEEANISGLGDEVNLNGEERVVDWDLDVIYDTLGLNA